MTTSTRTVPTVPTGSGNREPMTAKARSTVPGFHTLGWEPGTDVDAEILEPMQLLEGRAR